MKLGTLTAALVALSLAHPVSAQLEPYSVPETLGPAGGSAVSVVVHPVDPDEVLVIKYTLGIFRSTDGGDTFGLQPYGTGASGNVRGLTRDSSDPDTLYVMDGNQVFKSTDFGATWSPLSLVGLYSSLKSIAVAPSGDDLLALDAFNAYRSTDGGATWATVLQVVPFSGAVLGEVVYSQSDATVAYIAHSKGLYRSDDAGATFADTGPFDTWVDGLITSATDPYTVFAGTNFDGLFVSADGGVTMSPVTGASSGNGQWMAAEPGGLWYATLQDLDYSSDGGLTWVSVIDGLNDLTPIPADIATGPDGRRFLGCESNSLFADQTGGGLYRMPAGTPSSWAHIAFLTSPIPDVAIASPGGLRIIGFGNGVYSASPGADVKATSLSLIDTRAVAVYPDDSTRWLAGGVGAFFDNAQMHVLTGNGSNFFRTYERFGAGIVQDVEYDPFDSVRVLVGIFPGGFGNEAIIRSSNSGNSWIEVPGTAGWATRDIAYDPFTPGRVLQLSDNNQWAGSLDGGVSWSSLQAAWPASGAAVFLEFDRHEAGVLYRGDAGDGLWRSNDAGASWTALGVALDADSSILVHPQFPDLMWVANAAGKVLVSTDRGDSFQLALDVPIDSVVSSMALDLADGSMLIGTASASTWELPGASPAVVLGEGTAGSGGFVPSHYPAGGMPQIGNASFGLAGRDILGGGFVVPVVGLGELPFAFAGGTFWVDLISSPYLILPSVIASGTTGVAGDGAFTAPLPLPSNPSLVGAALVSQYAVIADPGAADPLGFVLSDALRTTMLN